MITLAQVQEFDQLLSDHVKTHHKHWFVGSPRYECVRFHIPHADMAVERQQVYRQPTVSCAHPFRYLFINWSLYHDQLLVQAEWRYNINQYFNMQGWRIHDVYQTPELDVGPDWCEHVGDVSMFESMLTELRLTT